MKIKNLVLGLGATTLAIGGVFASALFPIAQSVLVTTTTPPTCRQINPVECGGGASACIVKVNGTGGGNYAAYSDLLCQTPITGSKAPLPETTFK